MNRDGGDAEKPGADVFWDCFNPIFILAGGNYSRSNRVAPLEIDGRGFDIIELNEGGTKYY